MSLQTRLQRLREESPVLEVDERSRLVLISDCHRSNGSGADNFAKNQNLYAVALRHYEKNGFTYIELGDGDELWECRCFDDIVTQYHDLFGCLSRLHAQGRLHMLWGNHDMVKRRERWVRRHLERYRDAHSGRELPLFPGIRVQEALVLRERESGQELLLLHGHQADFFNDRLWWLARFLVRHVWRPLEMVGLRDPNNGAANSPRHRAKVDRRLARCAGEQGLPIVAGHTHRPAFAEPGTAQDPEFQPYFNDGCCVSLRQITALEIVRGAISQVRWTVRARQDGTLYVTSERMAGPVPLAEYKPA